MTDPIVDEVRKARDAYAARFGYDLDAIFRDLKEKEKQSGRKFVNFAKDETIAPPKPTAGGLTQAAPAGH